MKKYCKINFSVLLFFLGTIAGNAQLIQDWSDTISSTGYDQFTSVFLSPNGTVFSAGGRYLSNQNDTKFYLANYDSTGQLLWGRTDIPAGNGDMIYESLVVDNLGNAYVAGYFNFNSSYMLKVLKYDGQGNLIWSNFFPGHATNFNVSCYLAIDSLYGRIYLAGTDAYHSSITSMDMITGQVYWTNSSLTPIPNSPDGIVVDLAHQIYVLGSEYSNSPSYAVITRFDTSGAIIWQQTFLPAGKNYAYGRKIIADFNDNLIITGYAEAGLTNEMFTAKFDTSGVLQWGNIFTVSNSDSYGNDIAIAPNGNYYITGYSKMIGNNSYPILVGYDPAGNQVCSDVYTSWQNSAEGNRIKIDSFGGVYVLSTIIILKYNLAAQNQWLYATPQFHQHSDFCLDNSGGIYMTGSYFVTGSNYDLLTSKYNDITFSGLIEDYTGNTELVSIYPNPSSGAITVQTPLDTKCDKVVLGNFMGDLMSFELTGGTCRIEVNSFPPGLYFLSFYEGTTCLYSEKIIIK